MTEYARLVMVVDSSSAKKATDDLRVLDSQSKKTESAVSALTGAVKPLASAFAALKVGQLIQESTLLAARYDQLGLVMGVVGKNVGLSTRSLAELQAELEKTGISAIQSRNNIIKMIGANIDLSKATQLARLAQDAAVIGNTNSSEAFERLVRGIQSAEKETLETLGLNVNFQQSYEALAKQLGKSADQLTTVEKTQAAVSAALEAGKNIAGSYEASLGNANKQLQSASRYLENFQVKLGAAFQPQFAAGVTAYSDSLKFLNENVDGVVQVLDTGLYLAVGRVTAALVQKAGATALAAKETHAALAIEADAAAGALRTAESNKVAAKTELDRAAAEVASAEAAVNADRQRQASEVARLRSVQAALAAELELEQVRLKAQINEQGRAASVARMAELRLSEVAIIKQVEASERSLAATTVATSEAVKAAQVKKTAATAAYGEAALAVNAAVLASERAASSANVTARAVGGLAAAGRGLLGVLGGPAGLAITAGAVALSFVDFSDNADDAKDSADKLTGSVDKLTSAADRAQARFSGLLGNINRLTKAELQIRTTELQDQLRNAQGQVKAFERQFKRGVGNQEMIEGAKATVQLLEKALAELGIQAKANADQDTKEGQSYIKRLNEQRALLGVVTEEERVRAQIREGLIKVSPGEERRLLTIAREIDAYNSAKKAAQEAGQASKRSAEESRRASEQLAQSYISTEYSLEQQIALYGQTGEAAKLSFELQNGELSKLNEAQKERLAGLAKEIDRMNERKELQDQVRQIEESTWTDAQKSAAEYQAKIEALWQAKQKLNMSDEEYERRVNDVTEAWKRQGDEAKKSQDTFDEFTKNFIENVQGELADTLENGFSGSFDDIAQSWGNLLKRMIAEAVAADLMKRVFGEAGGGEKGATGLIGTLGSSLKNFSFSGIFDSFAGLFDRGGNIPAGGWGIVGEKGAEVVRGPATVTGREDTAKMFGSRGVNIGQLVLPNVTNAREARESAAAFGKRVNSIVNGSRRYG